MADEQQRYSVLDDHGLDVFLASMFGVVEENHIRKTTYETEMQKLKSKLTELESN